MKTKKKVVEKEKNKVISVRLRCENTYMNTHIEHRFKGKTIKAGMQVELKDDPRVWTIEDTYGEPIDKHTLHSDWNNNI